MKDYLKSIRNYIYYYIWIINGKTGPAPHIIYKRKRLSKYARLYNCETFIETGTYDGRTLMFLRKNFKKLLSVEIYKPCFENSLKRTEKYKNIQLFFGDSKTMLPLMTEQIEGRALFWLDGHYSGQGTGKGNSNCPTYDELEIIKNLKRNDHLILIDDAREFDGQSDYPAIELIFEKLKEINKNYKIEISYDCIIATPTKIVL